MISTNEAKGTSLHIQSTSVYLKVHLTNSPTEVSIKKQEVDMGK